MIIKGMPVTPERKRQDRVILLFVKSPDQGTVKSRLAEQVGEVRARELYRHFVLDMVETLSAIRETGNCTITLCVYPPEALEPMHIWLGSEYTYAPQYGRDLGERMKNAFLSSFAQGFQQVLLLGSDAPDLPGSIIKRGFNLLEEHGSVIGPAPDGGYYLIGFRSDFFVPAVFDNIPWSGNDVYSRTLKIFHSCSSAPALLPPWRDVDTLTDLNDLRDRHENDYFSDSRTMRYLRLHNI